jgi:NTP pyrophosphatase (non-canonical NTP hydrolase)
MSYFVHTRADLDAAVKQARAGYLAELAQESYDVAVSKGWENPGDTRSFGDECALLHSEVSEAFEAYRARGYESWEGPKGKPEGVASEFADVLIRLLHYSHVHGIDIQAEYDRKTAYNRTRAYQHGGKKL